MLRTTTREPEKFAGSIHEQEANEAPACAYCGDDVEEEGARCDLCMSECEDVDDEPSLEAQAEAVVEDLFTAEQKRRLRAYSAMCAAIHHHRTIWTRLYQGTEGMTLAEMGPRASRLLNRCGEVVNLIQRLAVASVEGK